MKHQLHKTFNCIKCAKCCYKFGITITVADLLREPKIAPHIITSIQVKNKKMKRYMDKKHISFAIGKKQLGAACVFLMPNCECLIYSTRPQICRDYPQEGVICLR